MDWRLGRTAAPRLGTPEGWDLSPGPPSGRDDTAASDPTSREVELLRTTKQNKGARRGKSHGAFRSPPAPSPQPEPSRGAQPAAPLAADQSLGSPWSLVSPRPPMTAAGEAAEGQPGMGKPDGSIPPPSSSIPPSGCPRPGRSPQGPGSPELTPGKGLPLSKGHHPSAVPGLGLVPSIPRPRGWRWGTSPNPGR